MTSAQANKSTDDYLNATAEIVAAYLLNHKTEIGELETLIQRIYGTLSRLNPEYAAAGASTLSGANIQESITPDYIVCLEDGKKLKMLKRYLKTNYNMTPEDYRKRWGLPASYPMVAPNYAKRRSDLAKQIGLGHKAASKAKRPALTGSRNKQFQTARGPQLAVMAESA